jgi:hypothetical protein
MKLTIKEEFEKNDSQEFSPIINRPISINKDLNVS